jgi:hypothetical protein
MDQELRQRIIDRYDVEELLEILNVSVEDICDMLEERVMEQKEYLDIWT